MEAERVASIAAEQEAKRLRAEEKGSWNGVLVLYGVFFGVIIVGAAICIPLSHASAETNMWVILGLAVAVTAFLFIRGRQG
jgi:hypothetical protein